MIRRQVTHADGSPDWVLISQVEHARLSAELAGAWGNDQFQSAMGGAPATVCEEVLAAIRHHDDGWQAWEASPQVDSVYGRPPSFLEMPLAATLPIWEASIERCARIGPLAAWMVAGHFVHLLSASESRHEPAAGEWLDGSAKWQDDWMTLWQTDDPSNHTQTVAAAALTWLQVMDALSLWFCCGSTSELLVAVPGEAATFARSEIAAPAGSETVTVSPWPFGSADISLQIDAAQVRARRYSSGTELATAATPSRLRWTLGPGG